jgi:hypothetical protein
MQQWADYLDELRVMAANPVVVPIKRHVA